MLAPAGRRDRTESLPGGKKTQEVQWAAPPLLGPSLQEDRSQDLELGPGNLGVDQKPLTNPHSLSTTDKKLRVSLLIAPQKSGQVAVALQSLCAEELSSCCLSQC